MKEPRVTLGGVRQRWQKKDERDKSLAYLDQHLSKGEFSFVNWGFPPVISRTFTSNFQAETYFNVQSKSKAQWHGYRLSLGVKQQTLKQLTPPPPADHPREHWQPLGCFYSSVCQSFPAHQLIWLCNAAKHGQLCRAAQAWNKKVRGLGQNKFLFWKRRKWFLPACSLLTHNTCYNKTCTSTGSNN